MSEIVQERLKKVVGREIKHLAAEFKNGYLLSEILASAALIHRDESSKLYSENVDSGDSNWERLYPLLKRIVFCTSKLPLRELIRGVKNGENSKTLILLEKVRVAIENASLQVFKGKSDNKMRLKVPSVDPLFVELSGMSNVNIRMALNSKSFWGAKVKNYIEALNLENKDNEKLRYEKMVNRENSISQLTNMKILREAKTKKCEEIWISTQIRLLALEKKYLRQTQIAKETTKKIIDKIRIKEEKEFQEGVLFVESKITNFQSIPENVKPLADSEEFSVYLKRINNRVNVELNNQQFNAYFNKIKAEKQTQRNITKNKADTDARVKAKKDRDLPAQYPQTETPQQHAQNLDALPDLPMSSEDEEDQPVIDENQKRMRSERQAQRQATIQDQIQTLVSSLDFQKSAQASTEALRSIRARIKEKTTADEKRKLEKRTALCQRVLDSMIDITHVIMKQGNSVTPSEWDRLRQSFLTDTE